MRHRQRPILNAVDKYLLDIASEDYNPFCDSNVSAIRVFWWAEKAKAEVKSINELNNQTGSTDYCQHPRVAQLWSGHDYPDAQCDLVSPA